MAHYDGMPQDIEWALMDGTFYLLQARPVTGADFRWEECIEIAAQNAPETDDIVWTQRWSENYWTGGISPLFYSVRVRHYRKSIEYFLDLCGFDELKGVPYFKYHRGTAYWNCNFQKGFAERIVPRALRAGAVAGAAGVAGGRTDPPARLRQVREDARLGQQLRSIPPKAGRRRSADSSIKRLNRQRH